MLCLTVRLQEHLRERGVVHAPVVVLTPLRPVAAAERMSLRIPVAVNPCAPPGRRPTLLS